MKYYNAYDARYAQVHGAGLRWFDGKVTPAVAQLAARLPKGARVLEIGCGEGVDAMAMLSAGLDVLATDVSPRAVDFCRVQYPECADRFRVLDALADPLEARFDAIVAVAVLHMLTEDSDRHALLTFIREHLTDAGAGLIVVMGDGEEAFASDPARAFELQDRVHEASGRTLRITSTSCRVVSRETLRSEIARAGLMITEEGATAWDDCSAAMYALVARGDAL